MVKWSYCQGCFPFMINIRIPKWYVSWNKALKRDAPSSQITNHSALPLFKCSLNSYQRKRALIFIMAHQLTILRNFKDCLQRVTKKNTQLDTKKLNETLLWNAAFVSSVRTRHGEGCRGRHKRRLPEALLHVDRGKTARSPFHWQFSHHNSNVMEILFIFALIQILMKWSLHNFVYDTTAVLSWHVQNFVAIGSPTIELQLNEFPVEFQLWWKKSFVKRVPWPLSFMETRLIIWNFSLFSLELASFLAKAHHRQITLNIGFNIPNRHIGSVTAMAGANVIRCRSSCVPQYSSSGFSVVETTMLRTMWT